MTKYAITKPALLALRPCNPEQRVALFGAAEALTVAEALNAGASVSDILWVAGALGFGTKCAEFAIKCAQSVAKYNTDPRFQTAIDAAVKCVAEPTAENKNAAYAAARAADAADAARVAAYAADAAAYAAYAAYAAARAAYAARAAAADAAADAAAYAARAAAYAAAYAADAAYAEQRGWLLEVFAG